MSAFSGRPTYGGARAAPTVSVTGETSHTTTIRTIGAFTPANGEAERSLLIATRAPPARASEVRAPCALQTQAPARPPRGRLLRRARRSGAPAAPDRRSAARARRARTFPSGSG